MWALRGGDTARRTIRAPLSHYDKHHTQMIIFKTEDAYAERGTAVWSK